MEAPNISPSLSDEAAIKSLVEAAKDPSSPLSVLLLCAPSDRMAISSQLQRSGLLVAQRWSTKVVAVVVAPNRDALRDGMARQMLGYTRRELLTVDFDRLHAALTKSGLYGRFNVGHAWSVGSPHSSNPNSSSGGSDASITSDSYSYLTGQAPSAPSEDRSRVAPSESSQASSVSSIANSTFVWNLGALSRWCEPQFAQASILQLVAPDDDQAMWLGAWGTKGVTFKPVNEQLEIALNVSSLWSQLKHPSIAELLGRSAVGHCAAYVLEDLPYTLELVIYQQPSELSSVDVVTRITLEVIAGLAYLHSMDVMHRNLRPRSIFLTARMCAASPSYEHHPGARAH